MSKLLIRGLIAGAVAALCAFAFAWLFGEPQIGGAIAFEEQLQSAIGMPAVPELVSRGTQSRFGLATALAIYGASIGGLFSLAFGFTYGRIGRTSARATAAMVAAGGFLAIALIPGLKYPANPPSVGLDATIGYRTALYFGLLALSVVSVVLAVVAQRRLSTQYSAWNAALIAGAGYLIVIGVAGVFLPDINEVPTAFPAVVLWRFRMAALGTQLVLWSILGFLFGVLAERVLRSSQPDRPVAGENRLR